MNYGDFYTTCRLDYHEEERDLYIELAKTNPDLLDEILKRLAPASGAKTPGFLQSHLGMVSCFFEWSCFFFSRLD
jgi:hypothetical protein